MTAQEHHLFFILQLLLTLSHLSKSHEFCQAQNQYKREHSNEFFITGLFSHSYKSKHILRGVMRMEVAKFAVKEANRDILASSQAYLGYKFYDICGEYGTTVKHMAEIILDTSIKNEQNARSTWACFNRTQNYCNKEMEGDRLLGVVGADSSQLSTVVSYIASSNGLPIISYASTSIVLSNKNLYPSFKRTIPPDNFQAVLITDILMFYNWTYVSILATDNAYGRMGKQELEKLFKRHDLCLAESLLIKVPPEEEDIDEAIRRLKLHDKATVVVLWSEAAYALTILKRAYEQRFLHRTWITSEAIGTNQQITDLPANLVTGLITIVANHGKYHAFEDYFWKLTYNATTSGSWIPEFFEQKGFNESSSKTLGDFKSEFHLGENGCVRNAVYAYAHALQQYALNSNRCDKHGCTVKKITNYQEFATKYLNNISFQGLNKELVQFDKNGDITNANYDVYILQQAEKSSGLEFKWLTSADKHGLVALPEDKNVHWHERNFTVPKSKCSDDCKPGMYAIVHGSIACCWECVSCPSATFKPDIGNGPCEICPQFSVSSNDRTKCLTLKKVFITIDSIYGTVLICMVIAGFVSGAFSILTFIVYRTTPVVKASNIKLSILQLSLQTAIACTPLMFIGEPTQLLCYGRTFVLGFLLTFNMAITLAKTQQLVAIFNSNYVLSSGKVKQLKSAERFIIATWVTIYSCVTVIGFIMKDTKVEYAPEEVYLTVDIFCAEDIHFVVKLVITFLVTINSVIQGVRVRKLPQNFNEARYIFYASFSTAILLLLAIPIKQSTSKPTATTFTITCIFWTINLIQSVILYGPKIWIIYFQPQKNTIDFLRKKVMDSIRAGIDKELESLPRKNVLSSNSRVAQ